jgi:hypothetical protein
MQANRPPMTDRTHGTQMRLMPFYYADGYGGIRFRVILDDGSLYWSPVSREIALKQIEQLARLLSEMEKT